MKHSAEIGKLAAALVAAQLEIRTIGTDAKNRFDRKYASLDSIMDNVRPILARHGLAVSQGATTPVSDAEGRLTAITLETMLIHSSGEWLTNGVVFPVGMTAIEKGKPEREPTAQTAAGAVTFGRRYGLASLLALTTGDDVEEPQERRPARRAIKEASYDTPATPAAVPAVRAADRRLPTPNGPRRLGDFSTPELVTLGKKALEAGKQDLADAIAEVLADRTDGGT